MRDLCDLCENGSAKQRKGCILKLADHRRWFDTIVIYVLQTFQFYLNDSVTTSVASAVKDDINLTTINLDCVILNSLKKQVKHSSSFCHASVSSALVYVTNKLHSNSH